MVGPAPVWIEGPPVAPRPFGLFTAAQVVEDPEARFLLGARYEVDYCGEATDSAGVCYDFGTATVAVNATRGVTIDAAGYPDGDYRILWGDETDDEGPETHTTLDNATHTYAADGTYKIIAAGPRSYQATQTVTVANGTAVPAAAAEVGLGKEINSGVQVVDGEGFAVLHLMECNPVGRPPVEIEDRARRALMMGEQRAVERVVARLMARHADTVILGGSTTHSVVDGLAILEKYAGANYPSRGIIHATPDVVTQLGAKHSVTRQTGGGLPEHLETVQGTIVASGGGYSPLMAPTPDTATVLPANAAGTEWLYLTGAMQVRRAAVIEVNALDRQRNSYQALAERPYVVTWECVTAAVKVATTEDAA